MINKDFIKILNIHLIEKNLKKQSLINEVIVNNVKSEILIIV